MTDSALVEALLRPVETTPRAIEPPAPTPRRRGPRRGWATWVIVIAVAAGLAWFGYSETQSRLDARSRLSIDGVSLTADPVVIEAIEGGTVTAVEVGPQQSVVAGDLIAVLDPPPGALSGPEPLEIRAPADGTVLQVISLGSTITTGDAIAVIYQPDEVYFQAPVDFAILPELTIGMTAHLEFPSIGRIEATIDRIETTLPTVSDELADGVVLILEPDDPAALRSVVPGLVLNGWIDTDSGPSSGVPAISSFGDGG